jgi:hypothetical protein
MIKNYKDGETRYKTKFLWLPQKFGNVWLWLETVTVRQIYLSRGMLIPGWYDVCLSNPESGLPVSIHPIGTPLEEHQESIIKHS